MKELVKSLKTLLFFSILLGLIYPVLVTIVSQLIFPYKANGSLVIVDGVVIGSELIGQKFTDPKYFMSRFSATGYNASGSGASNFGPSNKLFINQVAEKVKEIKTINMLKEDLPADMVLSSGSGLDPHISAANALIQADRIAKIRKIPLTEIKKLIDKNTDRDFIGIWGHSGVNVLKLNLSLDKIGKG